MQFRTLLATASIAAFGLTACDAGTYLTASNIDVPVNVSVDVADLAVSGVSVEVTGPGIDQPIIANLPITDNAASGTVPVLAGSDRSFLLRAFDTQGIETHQGSDTVDIAGTGPTALNVSLTPLASDVDVGGRIGDYTLAVSAASTTINAGQTAQLTVTVTDAYGATVTDAQVTWGSSNPSVASVSASGLAEGLVAGQTTVAANYKGFSGTLGLTVQ